MSESSLTSFLIEYKQVLKDYNDIKTSNADITLKLKDLPTVEKMKSIIEELTETNKTKIESTVNSLNENIKIMLGRFNWLLGAITIATGVGVVAVVYVDRIVKVVEKQLDKSRIEQISENTSKPKVYVNENNILVDEYGTPITTLPFPTHIHPTK